MHDAPPSTPNITLMESVHHLNEDHRTNETPSYVAWMWGVFGILSLFGLVTPNPELTMVGMIVPPLVFWLLWRPGEPPILAFAVAFQWLQAVSPVLAADYEGRSITDQAYGAIYQQAAWLSLMGVVVLALGMVTSLRGVGPVDHAQVRQFSERLSSDRLFVAYLCTLVVSLGLTWLSSRAGGLRQPILAISSIKWVPLFLLCWSTLQCRKSRKWMLAAVSIEVIIGFSGFFSSFKSVLFLLLIVTAGTSSDRPKLPRFELGVVCAITLSLVVFWQAVKSEYRRFLNQGTGQQVVLVPFDQRMEFLAKSFTRVTPKKMLDGIGEGVKRIGYIHYFAHSIRNVPKSIPHQNGSLWVGAVKHVFMPRILFPDKPQLDESSRTAYFTGLRVSGRREGTAISIGYIGESYIDFGKWMMAIPIFLLGMFYGGIYRYFVWKSSFHLIGFAISTTILLFSAIMLETSNIKIVGGVTTSLLAFWFLQFVASERLVGKVLARDNQGRQAN